MRAVLLACVFFLAGTVLGDDAPRGEAVAGSSVAFGEELSPDDLVTWYELEEMAAGLNQIVLPDCGLGGIRDDLARWIPLEGFEFVLKPAKMRRGFLYFDFVGFFDREYEPEAREKACLPSYSETRFAEGKGGAYGYVEVFVNGRRRAIFYRGRGAGFTGPVVVPVSREEFQGGQIRVRIVPSSRGFALWDVFVSHAPPED